MSQSLVPSNDNGRQTSLYAAPYDVSSTFLSRNPEEYVIAIRALQARQKYLQYFIRQGLSETSAPLGGTGISAQMELTNVSSNLRSAMFRLAFLNQGRSISPLPGYDELQASINAQGQLSSDIQHILNGLTDQRAKAILSKVLSQSGGLLSFYNTLLSYEGSKGISKLQTPDIEKAYGMVTSQLEALRTSLNAGRAASISIRRDVLEEARKSPDWDILNDIQFEEYKESIQILDPIKVGETPASRLRQLEAEYATLQAKLQKGDRSRETIERAAGVKADVQKLRARVGAR